MPHEKINRPDENRQQAVVGWSEIGWVQLSIYPEQWTSTGDATHVSLSAADVSKMIRVLRRARRKAYGKGASYIGIAERESLAMGTPLFMSEPKP